MTIAPRRKPVPAMGRLRRPLSLGTLQMMVMSGVVRRADLNPPPAPQRYEPSDNPHGASPQDSASERGWLSRMFLGRRAQATANR
ncbi:hypothetical protein [Nitrospira moscoviensis]|uniref:Uncharacterized protein n=1 Tax=Nitrospira moscoviensis TaxID=42253 RepID=A0A0K2GCC4_NITMO|nr:hypothetical protein [Nitrospira moscoviensis]ALA58598.1 hypothetical protein NITMOv2_2181 [Nitrospira moscoviensis]